MNTEIPTLANPSKLPSEVRYMIKNNSKFNPKPTNVPLEEQYMNNKNANRTLNLLGSNRDEKSRSDDKKALKISSLNDISGTALGKLNFSFLFLGFSLPKAVPNVKH
jgi:hypothetical protein